MQLLIKKLKELEKLKELTNDLEEEFQCLGENAENTKLFPFQNKNNIKSIDGARFIVRS